MRYHIDTIPVWDAMKQGDACPLCTLRRRVESMDVDRFLGGSVMEPDTRIRVNEGGFCPRHQRMLYGKNNRLGHALMMHTHAQETLRRLQPVMERAGQATGPRVSLLNRRGGQADGIKGAAQAVRRISGSCVLCQSVEENVRRYAYTFLHLYKTDAAFRTALSQSKGVCLPDLALLLEEAEGALSGPVLADFVKDLWAAVRRTMEKNIDDLEGFTLKFDYRNAQRPWGDSRGSLERTVNQLRGWCLGEEMEE